jgi:hypothetical protein
MELSSWSLNLAAQRSATTASAPADFTASAPVTVSSRVLCAVRPLVASLPLVSVVLFELLRVLQGEPAKHAGEGDRDAEQVVRRQVGSDGPLPEQFVT